MGRIPDKDRLPVADAHVGHWQQADTTAGEPIVVEGQTIADLQAKRTAYHDKQVEVEDAESDLEFQRAQRKAVFGEDSQAKDGVWFQLKLYKRYVQRRVKKSSPLGRTVPNIGRVTIENYETILHRFIKHWTRANSLLGAALTLGDFTLADLQAAHDQLVALAEAIETADEVTLPFLRAEREEMFGDVDEEERDEDSILWLLLQYHSEIEARFAGEPLAASLPEIFADGGPATLPAVEFEWAAEEPNVRFWFRHPQGLSGVTSVFVQEGVEEFSTAVNLEPGQSQQLIWPNVTIVDEIDVVELRDSAERTVARGVRTPGLPDPGP